MRCLLLAALAACNAPAPAPLAATVPATTATPPRLVLRGAIAVAEHHACAVRADGHLACWGKGTNAFGHPDDADELIADQLVPVDVPGLHDIAGVALRGSLACAWSTSGQAWCWGGAEELRQRDHRPRRVPGLADLVQIVIGTDLMSSRPVNVACGLRTTGRVACWSRDTWENPLLPASPEVVGIRDAVEIASDGVRVCARTRSGDVECAGIDSARPATRVPALAGVISLAGGDSFAALVRGHQLASWGGIGGDRVQLLAAPPSADRAYVGSSTCVSGNGRTTCWAHDDAGGLRAPTSDLPPAIQELAPSEFGGLAEVSCLRARDGVQCWGPLGELGDESRSALDKPVAVRDLTDARQLELAPETACVLRATGRIACWGGDDAHALPRELPGVTDALEIAVATRPSSGDGICARRPSGVTCWASPTGAPHASRALAGAARLLSGPVIASVSASGQVLVPGSGKNARLTSAWARLEPLCDPQLPVGPEEVPSCWHAADARLAPPTLSPDEDPGPPACSVARDSIACDFGGGATHGAVAPFAGRPDVAELRANQLAVCARLQSGAVECWGDRDALGAGLHATDPRPRAVPGLVTGPPPTVVPRAATVTLPVAVQTTTILRASAMRGPYLDRDAACRALDCPAGEAPECRDRFAAGEELAEMPAPAAAVSAARLLTMACLPAERRGQPISPLPVSVSLLVVHAGATWLSEPLFTTAAAPCDMSDVNVLGSWAEHDLVAGGEPELVVTVLERVRCIAPPATMERDRQLLLVVGSDGHGPFTFPPIQTATGSVNACRPSEPGCTTRERTDQPPVTLQPDRSIQVGATAYRFAR